MIKSIILTKKQHDELFSMIKGDWANVTKLDENSYRVEATKEEEFRGWRFKRIMKDRSIELYRYMGDDWERPKTEKIKMHCTINI